MLTLINELAIWMAGLLFIIFFVEIMAIILWYLTDSALVKTEQEELSENEKD